MTIDSHTRPTSRTLTVAAGVAAAAFGLLTAVQIASPPQTEPFSRPSDYLIESLFCASLVAGTVAVALLHRRHRWGRWGRFGALAAVITGAGTALLAVVVGATLIHGGDALGVLFFPGLAAWALGGVLLAVATFRARLLPRPVAILFAAAVPLAGVIGEPAGPVAVAVLWGAVAYVGRRSRD